MAIAHGGVWTPAFFWIANSVVYCTPPHTHTALENATLAVFIEELLDFKQVTLVLCQVPLET